MSNLSIFSSKSLAESVLNNSVKLGLHIASAESLTGGLLADAFVSVPGASKVFCGSAVTYDIHAKSKILGVDAHLLQTEGAVNQNVAMQMAVGASRIYRGNRWFYESDLNNSSSFPIVGLSTTGVAGPGPDGNKPAGLVYVGIFLPNIIDFYDAIICGSCQELENDFVNNMWDYSDNQNVILAFELRLSGSREEVRNATVCSLLTILNDLLTVVKCGE